MVFSDGGARGNPGPAAIAFIIQSETGHTVIARSRYVGVCTNNQAEYRALLAALETAVARKTEKVICHLDSELVAKQLSGEYTVKNKELKQLWEKVQDTTKRFKEVKIPLPTELKTPPVTKTYFTTESPPCNVKTITRSQHLSSFIYPASMRAR